MYNFEDIINRNTTNSIKWLEKDVIPLWIADMDFSFPKEVKDGLLELITEGVLGYADVDQKCYESIINFYKEEYDLNITKANIIFNTGVIASLGAVLNTFLQAGEEVLFLTPCYNTFFSVVNRLGYKVVESKLDYCDGEYTINFADFAKKIQRSNLRAFVLCNPHNPIGKIWSLEDLIKIRDLCTLNGVLVISDEIHGLISRPNYKYNSYLKVSKEGIILSSPSKPFNMAGLKIGFSICYDEHLNQRLALAYNRFGLTGINSFAIKVLPILYNKCRDWLKEMNEYVYNNYKFVKEYFEDNNLKIGIIYGNATYLLWLDVSYYTDNSFSLSKLLKTKFKVFVSEGSKYLGNGQFFIRINIATSRNILKIGLDRIRDGLLSLNQQ